MSFNNKSQSLKCRKSRKSQYTPKGINRSMGPSIKDVRSKGGEGCLPMWTTSDGRVGGGRGRSGLTDPPPIYECRLAVVMINLFSLC